MSQQNDNTPTGNTTNNTNNCNCRNIEAWAETLSSLFNFLVAQTNLATVLDRSPLIQPPAPRQMLLQAPQNASNTAEYNIEDFPWFLNEMHEAPTTASQNVKTTYFFTISPPQVPTVSLPRENVYSEPIPLPHNISFMDSLNMGDCSQIERTIENIHLLEQSIMQSMSQNYDSTVFSYLQNMQQPPQMENLNDSPNISTVGIEDLDEFPSKFSDEPQSHVSESSVESAVIPTSVDTVADGLNAPSDEFECESSQQSITEECNIESAGELYEVSCDKMKEERSQTSYIPINDGFTSDETEDESIQENKPNSTGNGMNQMIPEETSNLSCYFHEYTDSDQSIDSQNLQSACESLYNVDSGDDDNSMYYDVCQNNKRSVPDSTVGAEDMKVEFVMNLVNELLKDIEQFKGTCDVNKVVSEREDDNNCSRVEHSSRDFGKISKSVSPKRMEETCSKSEEMQTVDKRRFHGTLKAVIAKTAEKRKSINNERISNEELPETILKITNTFENPQSTSDVKKKTFKAKPIPKNIQELKEKLDALHRLRPHVPSASAAVKRTDNNQRVLNRNSYAVTKKRSESPKPSSSTKPKVTHSSRYANVESKVKKMLEANRSKTEGDGRTMDNCKVLKSKTGSSKDIGGTKIDRTSVLKQQLDRLRLVSKGPETVSEKQILSKPTKDARASKESLVKKASFQKPALRASRSRPADSSRPSVTKPEVKTTRISKEKENSKKVDKAKLDSDSGLIDSGNSMTGTAVPKVKKIPRRVQGHD